MNRWLSQGRRITNHKSWPCLLAGFAICILASAALPQERPLERSFSAGSLTQYRVRLTVRSELSGQQPVQRAGAVYAQAFTRIGEGRLEWLMTEHVLEVAADGSASIEETLDHFESPVSLGSPQDPEAQRLASAILAAFTLWSEPASRLLHYREASSGELTGLKPEGVPNLGEAVPPLLSLWLLRALRPAASLPTRLVRFGARWQEPRTVKLDGWADVHAWESGEWLQAVQPPEPAARLFTVQQIFGTVTVGAEKSPEGSAQGSFHGESLVTLGLADGRLLVATRSAAREISWKLAPVSGLIEQPEFRARLSAEVEIESCRGPCGP